MSSGECQTRNVAQQDDDDKSDAPPPLDSEDIALLKSYGLGPYSVPIKEIEAEIQRHQQTVKDLIGIKESDTGLSQPSQWDLVGDKQMMQEEAPLQVARCTKIIAGEVEGGGGGGAAEGAAAAGGGGVGGGGGAAAAGGGPSAALAGNKYVINVKQIAKFVVGLGEKVAPTDIEEGMRVGVDRAKYSIQIPLPPKIDPTVSLMTVEDKPDVTYDDVGGAKDAMEKLREVLETPLLHPERFVALGIDPPKGVLLYGPPGTGEHIFIFSVPFFPPFSIRFRFPRARPTNIIRRRLLRSHLSTAPHLSLPLSLSLSLPLPHIPPRQGKTLAARAVANRTDACFIRVIGSELVQKYVGEGARMVRELFTMARSKRACIIFFDEIDAIGGARSGGDDNGSDNEVQRTMLQIVTELDGFDARGNIKVLMATNRPDTLDPALLRPGRLDRKVEFGLPDLEGRGHILKIHSKRMNCDRDIRFELIARLCPSTTGAELHSVCTEAGMFAIRARRKSVSEKDFLDSVNKVVKGYKKFSSTPKVSHDEGNFLFLSSAIFFTRFSS
jgi:26S proteasome regulatory subunit T1